uniref:SEFIR domain-containing protein n=1 Tax=Candidatus Kentrum sp. FW TaxID=2126338 RepID=A0A450RYL1_9GAMM|nr:MAG: SEFIR domain-containing protein [Candidatus Kentron sp. FW]
MKKPRIFISYAHDSDAHRERVLGLSERLRRDGFDTRLDQYVEGSPEEGWQRWMLNQLDKAEFVLAICTETYYQRFRDHDYQNPERGRGVDWEGAIITQEIHDNRGRTRKFVPVLIQTADTRFIPEPLRKYTHYQMDSAVDYQQLCNFLAGAAGVEPGPVGTPPPKTRRQGTPLAFEHESAFLGSPHIAPSRLPTPAGSQQLFGRDREFGLLDDALAEPKIHLVQLIAWGGVGKTALATHWMTKLAARNWIGGGEEQPIPIRYYFDWSFYSQGIRDQGSVSSDPFMAKALEFFGDPDPGPGSPHDRGARLAELVARRPSILILDGIEPLQYGPGPLQGRLRDPALRAFLKGLARRPLTGICIITSRQRITDLDTSLNKTVIAHELHQLSEAAGAALLYHVGAKRRGAATINPGHRELLRASREVAGHALTLTLLGGYLSKAHGGDIRRRDRVRLDEADKSTQGEHAIRVMVAYEQWLMEKPAKAPATAERNDQSPAPGGIVIQSFRDTLNWFSELPGLVLGLFLLNISLLFLKISLAITSPNVLLGTGRINLEIGRSLRSGGNFLRRIGNAVAGNHASGKRDSELRHRMLAILRLLGLFDRPAAPGALAALCRKPTIPGLTEDLVDAGEEDWNQALFSLRDLDLVSGQSFGQLDAHPLVRAYFTERLRGTPAWIEGHTRLYRHFTETTPYRPDTLEDLQPLYQAVLHGCQAGLHQEICNHVYIDRILRGTGSDGFYSAKKLGAIGADLGAIACFFDRPWQELSANLSPAARSWLFNESTINLRALGRLQEALEPMRAGLGMHIEGKDWKNAAVAAGNLSQLELTLGEISKAMEDAKRSVQFADTSGDIFRQMVMRTAHGDARHQAGDRQGGGALFQEAENLQAEHQSQYPWLYSLPGFQYCDLLLSVIEEGGDEGNDSGVERAAWRIFLIGWIGAPDAHPPYGTPEDLDAWIARCDQVSERATQTLELAERNQHPLLDIALNHLTLARAEWYRNLLSSVGISAGTDPYAIPPDLPTHLAAAVDGLRQANMMEYLPRALLTRAWYRAATGDGSGAWTDLEEVRDIAEDGPMPLFMTDCLLTRARLFGSSHDYPWESVADDLAVASQLIDQHGYHRRDGELADVKSMIEGKSADVY